MGYQVKLPVFEGPLDLLLHLLEKDEIDIWDIPIVRITDQYLAYLNTLQELDLAVGGEFLVMAATLIQLKARTLLPQPTVVDPEDDSEIDPMEELTARLLEYKAYKEIAAVLEERMDIWGRIVFRPNSKHQLPVRYENPIGNATILDLWRCFQQLMEARHEALRVRQVKRRKFSLRRRMGEIFLALRKSGATTFSRLLSVRPSKEEIVVTFLAILELVRRGHIDATQYGNFTDIHLKFLPREMRDQTDEAR